MFDHVERPAAQGGFVELREVPHREAQGEDHTARDRVGEEGQRAREPGPVLEEAVDELGRQAGDDERGGDVDEQHVLQHVGPEQEAFAELVQRRTHRDITDEHAEMETHGMPDGILRPARHPPRAVRTAGQGVGPGGPDDQEQQERLRVPVQGDVHR